MWIFVHRREIRLEREDVEDNKRREREADKRKVKNDSEIRPVNVRFAV